MEQSTLNIEIMTTQTFRNHQSLVKTKISISYTHLKNSNLDLTVVLDLQTKINLPDGIEASIGLLPSFVARNLTIENFRPLSNKTKDDFLQLDILNRNFYNTASIKKN